VINARASFAVHDDRLRTEGLVSAAVELTAYQLMAPAQSRPARGQFDFRLGRANVAVEFRSEAARIDLNAASKQLLSGLFAVLGASADDAQIYAERISNWRNLRPGEGDAEALAYKAAGLPYAPRGTRFLNVNELPLVLGLPATLVERAMPFITVFNGRPQVNAMDAAPEVLAALPGMTAERLNDFLAQRQATPGNDQILMPLLGPAQAYATAQGGNTSRITVRIIFDNGSQASSEVVILLSGQGNEPFSVLSWHDDLDARGAFNRGRAGS
jgi:general secretion pathway protein K